MLVTSVYNVSLKHRCASTTRPELTLPASGWKLETEVSYGYEYLTVLPRKPRRKTYRKALGIITLNVSIDNVDTCHQVLM